MYELDSRLEDSFIRYVIESFFLLSTFMHLIGKLSSNLIRKDTKVS
jgi:hypothetical protein